MKGAAGALVVVMTALVAVPARAADVVVLSAGGPGGDADVARAAVIDALAADGLAVVADGDVALRIPPSRLRGVDGGEPARAIAFEFEARMAVVVALFLHEGAVPVEGDVVVTLFAGSRSWSATESFGGERALATAAAAAARGVRAQQTRAMVIEGTDVTGTRSRSGAEAGSQSEAGAGAGTEAGSRSEAGAGAETGAEGTSATPYYDVIGPTMLLAFGAAGIGLGAYALLDGTCELRGASGTCLRGEDPNVPAGVTLTVAGGLALVGGVIWLVTGASVGSQPRIDVVMGPDGGAICARGRF